MLILFDHGTPRGLAVRCEAIPSKKQKRRGGNTLSNGELLRAAEEAGFDVFLTTDTNLPYQQNLEIASWRS
jgi:hypothetical protein